MRIVKFVIVGVNEVGEDFNAGSFECPKEYWENPEYSEIWFALVNLHESKAREKYPEARGFVVERKISDMSLSELRARDYYY